MPGVTVKTKGPIFDGRAGQIINEESRSLVRTVVELGENRLSNVLRPRPAGVYLSIAQGGKSTGNYRSHLHARSTGLHGIITDSGVIYGPWLEGTSSRNVTTRFKGYASFRKTGQWLQQQVPRLLQKTIARVAQRLNSGG